MKNANRGKLIVIEGIETSGKATQTKLLVDFLNSKKIEVKSLSFPRYSLFYGKLIARFLKGDFGKISQVSPYLVSVVYALDRLGARQELLKWLSEGELVICDRYVTSNLAHQGARVPEGRRPEFLAWLEELEYKVNKLPREDLVIYLHVPWEISLKFAEKKKQDLVETDIKHRQEAEKIYLWFSKKYPNWVKISCCHNGKILPREEIRGEILKVLKDKKII